MVGVTCVMMDRMSYCQTLLRQFKPSRALTPGIDASQGANANAKANAIWVPTPIV